MRSLMKGLGVPVINQFGLRPAVVSGTDQIAPLTIDKDLDDLGLPRKWRGFATFRPNGRFIERAARSRCAPAGPTRPLVTRGYRP